MSIASTKKNTLKKILINFILSRLPKISRQSYEYSTNSSTTHSSFHRSDFNFRRRLRRTRRPSVRSTIFSNLGPPLRCRSARFVCRHVTTEGRMSQRPLLGLIIVSREQPVNGTSVL